MDTRTQVLAYCLRQTTGDGTNEYPVDALEQLVRPWKQLFVAQFDCPGGFHAQLGPEAYGRRAKYLRWPSLWAYHRMCWPGPGQPGHVRCESLLVLRKAKHEGREYYVCIDSYAPDIGKLKLPWFEEDFFRAAVEAKPFKNPIFPNSVNVSATLIHQSTRKTGEALQAELPDPKLRRLVGVYQAAGLPPTEMRGSIYGRGPGVKHADSIAKNFRAHCKVINKLDGGTFMYFLDGEEHPHVIELETTQDALVLTSPASAQLHSAAHVEVRALTRAPTRPTPS